MYVSIIIESTKNSFLVYDVSIHAEKENMLYLKLLNNNKDIKEMQNNDYIRVIYAFLVNR